MKKLFLNVALILFATSMCFAQEKTADELKAERDTLKEERKSERYLERQKKLVEYKNKNADITGISSIDDLASNSKISLLETMKTNELLPELYKRTIGETVDGVTDVTTTKPSLDTLLEVSVSIMKTTKAVMASSEDIVKAQGDIKSEGILKAAKASKSVKYSKDANSLMAAELAYQKMLINNLIATLKSSKNF